LAVEGRARRSEIRWAAIAALGVVLLSSLPYVIVALTTPAELRFGGALVNPIDGQSYFAKMRQGYDGAWLFRLPFTADDEPDAFLFTFHLGLGHLARLTGLSLPTLYHAARVLGGWALLVVLYPFVARTFDAPADRRRAWMFVALAAGLGWISSSASDVAIPESNTFFSLLANAHFAASMLLMLIIFTAVLDGVWRRAVPASIGLAILQPFAPIAVFATLGVFLILRWLRPSPPAHLSPSGGLPQEEGRRVYPFRQALVTVVAGLSITPLMLYFYFATQRDPILQQWSAQNVTPSPPPIDYVLGYGLIGLLAIPGARAAWRRGREVDVLLLAWAVSSALLLYAPFPLQRRFSLGLHIPIALLGVMGLTTLLSRRWPRRIVFLASLPTTLVLLLATSSAALRPPDGRLFFSANEAAAFDWLREHAPHHSVVLAAPDTGLFLPAWADVRVVYGHPFETLDAEDTQRIVERFFSGEDDRGMVLRRYGVDYIFFGPRERNLGRPDANWQAAFAQGDVTIYQAP
jgi:hypothetical protein